MTTKTAIINGTPYLSPVGVNAGESLGNTSKLTYTAELEEKTLTNYQGGGGNDDKFTRYKSIKVALSARHVSISVLELALGGKATAVAAGAVADEPHTVIELGKLIALDSMQDMSKVITVKKGATTFVEGEDFTRVRAGIIPIATGDMVAADAITVSYTKAAHQRIQAALSAITERGLLFDGRNERSGAPWACRFHRVAWSPAKSIELIGEDFASFDLEGEVLAWDGITDPTKSQFLEMLVGDL